MSKNKDQRYALTRKLSVMSLNMEQDRTDSLNRMAGMPLTSISIISVALLSVTPSPFNLFDCHPGGRLVLTVFLLITFLPIVISFTLAFISQMRFRYRALPSPLDIRETLMVGGPYDDYASAKSVSDVLSEIHDSIDVNNNRARALLSTSMYFLLAAIFFIIVDGIVIVTLCGAWCLF